MTVAVLSASQVGTYQSCSLKWALRHVHRADEESRSAALVVGSAVDVAIKTGVHLLKSGEVPAERLEIERIFLEAWDAELAANPGVPVEWGRKGQSGHRDIALGVTRAFLDAEDLPERVARIEALDVRFELPVVNPDTGRDVPGLTMVGILDAVERTEQGLRPLDWKTSASRAGWDRHSLEVHPGHLQGALYSDAIRRLHPTEASGEVAFAVLLKLKSPVLEDHVITVSDEARRRAILTVLHSHRAMQLGVAFPQPSFLCGGCPYQQRCGQWELEARSPGSVDPFAA